MRLQNVLMIVIFAITLNVFTSCEEVDPTDPITGVLAEYSNVKLTFSTLSMTETNMFNMDNGLVLDATGNAADMDIAYCWDDNAVHSIVSPNSAWLASVWDSRGVTYDTSDKNATKLGKVDVNFANITVEDISNINVSAGNDIKNLNIGDVVAFETADGVKGFLEIDIKKVTSSIYINVKYLKPIAK